jgi:hypothetical protein
MSDTPSSSSNTADCLPRIFLRIPAPWGSVQEATDALKKAKTGYAFQLTDRPEDAALVHLATGRKFEIVSNGPDDQIADIFAESGRMSESEIRELADHAVKLFITGPGGSLDAARDMLAAGAALIKAGAFGVMVDNSGTAHGARDWLQLAGDKQLGGMYWAFVAVTATEEEVFSTGMHCLGFRDAELPTPASRREGGTIMHEFLGYSYQSGAVILDDEVLGEENEPEFRVRHLSCTRFPPDSPWYNPYGAWRLEKYTEDEDN